MPQIYVIYRPEDARKKSKEIITVLEKNYGAPTIQSPDYDEYLDVYAIEQDVKMADFLLVVIGNYWADLVDESGVNLLNSVYDPVHMAIATAINSRKQVIPVLVDGASMPHPSRLPRELRKLATQEPIKLDKNAPLEKSLIKGLKDIIKSESRLKIPDFVQQAKLPQRPSTPTPTPSQQPRLRQATPSQKHPHWLKRSVVVAIALVILALIVILSLAALIVSEAPIESTSNTDFGIVIEATALPPTFVPTVIKRIGFPTAVPSLPQISVDNASQLSIVQGEAITTSPTELVLFSQDQTLFFFLSSELQEVQIKEISTEDVLKTISTAPYEPIAIQLNPDESRLLILLNNGQVMAWGMPTE